jgi:leucyl aminopeptidase
VTIEIIRGVELEKKGFGGIYNVGKGSSPDRQPALVVLKYDSRQDGAKNVSWVGKGIVFDTG